VLSTHAVKIVSGTQVMLDRWAEKARCRGACAWWKPSGFTKISALGVEEQRVRVIIDLTSPREVWQRLGRRLPGGSSLRFVAGQGRPAITDQRAISPGRGLGGVRAEEGARYADPG